MKTFKKIFKEIQKYTLKIFKTVIKIFLIAATILTIIWGLDSLFKIKWWYSLLVIISIAILLFILVFIMVVIRNFPSKNKKLKEQNKKLKEEIKKLKKELRR